MKAYTIGYMKNYDKALQHESGCLKIGAKPVGDEEFPEGYDGGCVWETAQQAAAFLQSAGFDAWFPGRDPNTFAVYELDLPDWASNVSAVPHADGVHRLLRDVRIVGKVEMATVESRGG